MSDEKSSYQQTFDKHGDSPKALQWKDYRSAVLRYKQLLGDIDPQSKTILDVGCGMGDLLPFLYTKSTEFDYLGVDVVSEFIEIAQKRYEGHKFKLLNPFKENVGQTFDLVIVCGALNANTPNWLEERKHAISKLYSLASEALAFNMAGSFKPETTGKRVSQADVQQILKFCTSLTPKIILKTHYHPKDFTIVMFK